MPPSIARAARSGSVTRSDFFLEGALEAGGGIVRGLPAQVLRPAYPAGELYGALLPTRARHDVFAASRKPCAMLRSDMAPWAERQHLDWNSLPKMSAKVEKLLELLTQDSPPQTGRLLTENVCRYTC